MRKLRFQLWSRFWLIGGMTTLLAIASGQPAATTRESRPRSESSDWTKAIAVWEEFRDKFRKHSFLPPSEEEMTRELFEDGVRGLGMRFRGREPSIAPGQNVQDRVWLEGEFRKLAEVDGRDPVSLVEDMIDAYCRSHDLYARYVRSEEAGRLSMLHSLGKSGVGMQLEIEDSGRLFCYPFPGGPAEKAGIQHADQLISVDGVDMRNATLGEAALAIVGTAGSRVLLEVEHTGGRHEIVNVERAAITVGNVMSVSTPVGRKVRIRNFRKGAARDLRDMLADTPDIDRLTLDLRGNSGGLLNEAVLAASIFLQEGTVIGSVETRVGTETFRDGNGTLCRPKRLSILVDARTASSAEFFAEALLKNLPDVVTVYGEQTLGKGVALDQLFLNSGGRLTVTSGRLFGPDGTSWDGKGISPNG